MSRTIANTVAEAIRETLISPNVSDSNWEPANVVDSLARIGDGIHLHVKATAAAGERIGSGLDAVAAAICNLAEAVRESSRK